MTGIVSELLAIDPTVIDPVGITVILLATLFAFLIASILGIGGPLLLIPAVMLYLPPVQAVTLMAPVLMANSIAKVWLFRSHIRPQPAWRLTAGAMPAATVAALFTHNLDEQLLKAGIALLILLSLSMQYGLSLRLRVNLANLSAWGALIGVIAGLASIAGPPTAMVVKAHGLVRQPFVATIAVMQIGIQLVRLPTYLANGALPFHLLPLAFLMCATAMASTTLAKPLLRVIDAARFRTLVDLSLLCFVVWLVASTLLA